MIVTLICGVFSFLNGSLFPALLAAGGIIYFGWVFYKANAVANRNRKEVQQDIINRAATVLPKKDYYVASAGSNVASAGSKESEACAMVSAIDIQQCNFCDSDGKPLNLSLYNCYVVHGDSMKYAGINDKDFIFVPKIFNLDSLKSFPEILVIRYRERNENKPLYKVRRGWYIGSIEDNLKEAVRIITENPKFNGLSRQEGFKGAEWMTKDLLEKRLEDYRATYFKDGECPEEYKRIVISTTFDTVKKEIHFSIHPVSLIVGEVAEAYSV